MHRSKLSYVHLLHRSEVCTNIVMYVYVYITIHTTHMLYYTHISGIKVIVIERSRQTFYGNERSLPTYIVEHWQLF